MIRYFRRAFALALVAQCIPYAAFAAPPGFAFLEIPSGARAAALGGAFASMASGIEAQFWNPAGLSSIGTFQVEGTHTELIAGLRHDTFSAGGRVGGGGLAGSFRAFYTEPIDERDDLGNLIGSFGSHDLELGVAYGWPIAAGLEMGFSGQVIRERIANLAATTYAFGAGAAWQPAGLEGLRIGGALQNLGPSAHYTIDGIEGEPVGLPMAVQGGGTYSMNAGERIELQGAIEGRFTRGRAGQGMTGLEIRDASGASLRGGWRFNDDATTYSLGAGYAMPGLRLDYAYVPLRLDLGDTHRFGFTALF